MSGRWYGSQVLLRHVRPAESLRDALVLVLAGALGAFAVLFTLRTQFDRFVFEQGLGYATKVEAAVPGRLTVVQLDGVQAAAPSATPSGGSRIADYEHARAVPVHAFAPALLDPARRVYSGVILRGGLSEHGVVLDEATAAAFGADVGDEVVLAVATDTALRELPVRISGISRPYHTQGVVSAGGFVLASTAALDGLADDATPRAALTYDPADPSGAVGHARALLSTVGDSPAASTFLLVVLGLGLGVWGFAVVRVAHELRRRLDVPGATLVRLGTSPVTVGLTPAALVSAVSTVAAVLAGMLARELTIRWTGMYVQVAEVSLVATLMLVVAVGAASRRTVLHWTTGGDR